MSTIPKKKVVAALLIYYHPSRMHLAAASNRSGKAFGSITRLLNPDDDRIFRASQNVVGDFLKRVVLSRIEGISGGLHGSAHIL
jgi:hypothetical protein